MDFNGNPISGSSLSNGGIVNGNLEVDGTFIASDSISLLGKYKLPITAPLEPNSAIVSNGTDQLIWTGDLSIGDVTSITASTVNNEVVLFNMTTGKSIKNSGVTVVSGIVNDNGEVMVNNVNNSDAAILKYEKSRAGGAVQASDSIGIIDYKAHDGTSLNSVASIRCATEVNMTPTNRASQLQFSTTNENAATESLKLTIWDGGVEVEDKLVTPNVYVGPGGAGNVMYIQNLNGTGDGLEIRNKNDRLVYEFNDRGLAVTDDSNNIFGGFFQMNRTKNGGSLATGDQIGSIHWTAQTSLGLKDAAEIRAEANENYSSASAHGSKLVFDTVKTGEVNVSTRMTIDDNLNILQGTALNLYNTVGDWKISNPNSNLQFDKSNGRAQIYYGGSTVGAVRGNDDSAAAIFDCTKSRGFVSTPTAVLNNDNIAFFRGQAHNGTSFVIVSNIETKATENHGPGASGVSMTFKTINNGTAALVNKMVIDTDGVNILTPLNIGSVGAGTNYILPSTKGTTGQHLRLNGNNMEWTTDGGGDVVGPVSSTDNYLPRFNGSTGKLLKTTGVGVIDTNQMFYNQGFTTASVMEYCFFRKVEPTVTVTGTTPVNLVTDVALPVAISWVGKTLKCYMSGTVTNANNESLRHTIEMFNKGGATFATTTGLIATNHSPFEFEYKFEISFRSDGTGIGWYEYIIIDNDGTTGTRHRRRATIADTWDTSSTTFPFKINSFWLSSNVANIAYYRNIRISFI